MYIANTQVITSEGTFAKGETVKGLTEADITRMLAGGYITEKEEPKVETKDDTKKANKGKQAAKEHNSEEVE